MTNKMDTVTKAAASPVVIKPDGTPIFVLTTIKGKPVAEKNVKAR